MNATFQVPPSFQPPHFVAVAGLSCDSPPSTSLAQKYTIKIIPLNFSFVLDIKPSV